MEENKINIEEDFVNNKTTKAEKEKLIAENKKTEEINNAKIFKDNIRRTINIFNNIEMKKDNKDNKEGE